MDKKVFIVFSVFFVCVTALLIHGPIPQDLNYHNFIDKRKFFGVPNFLNVITNVPFFFVGLLGLPELWSIKEKRLKQIGVTIFSGFLILCFGSGYYHLTPNNITLVYDRLPMVIIFMSFFSFIIYDCIDSKTGYNAFFILNITGILTVIYWILTERVGKGDLRWYAMIQFFPLIAIPLILGLYKSSFNYLKQITTIFIFFILAKLAEQFDEDVYSLLNNIISGHSLKHLLMAGAEYVIVVMMGKRVKER